jgi:hypothetical protein
VRELGARGGVDVGKHEKKDSGDSDVQNGTENSEGGRHRK